jgi:hypothetical protein
MRIMDYQTPELTRHGSVTELTATVNPSTLDDVNEETGDEGQGSFSIIEEPQD